MGMKSGSGDRIYDDGDDEADDAGESGESEGANDGVEVDDAVTESPRSEQTGTSGQETDRVEGGDGDLPYVVRRSIRDKGIQYERDERLTFFVHDDVARTESEIVSQLEADLGRDLPVMDVREAAYRFALTRKAEILQELLEMGYRRE